MIPVKYDRRKQNCLWEFLANVTVWFYMFFFYKINPESKLDRSGFCFDLFRF